MSEQQRARDLEVTNWSCDGAAKLDEEDNSEFVSHLDWILDRLERCNMEDPNNWQELTGASRADLRKSLGL